MAHELRVGLIGLDTSHVPAFTKRLNDMKDPEHVPGARVVAGFPGGSKDFELSSSRVEGFTNTIKNDYGVEILDSPEAVAEAVDIVFLSAVDGRAHLDFVKRIAKFKRPTFIDKPMATTSADAAEMFRLAREGGFPLMSCSSLRYADNLLSALKGEGAIVSCDIFGPVPEEPTQPGWFWYGVHSIEILNRVMGRGCKAVQVTKTDKADIVAALWSDGRAASVHGMRDAHHKFGVTLHRDKDFQFVDLAGKRAWYTGMLEAILRTLPQGKSDVAPEDTLEIIRIIEAINKSREGGNLVNV
jgi:predicted dehydrogenase